MLHVGVIYDDPCWSGRYTQGIAHDTYEKEPKNDVEEVLRGKTANFSQKK